MKNQVTILGARGSIPVSGAQFRRYGGSTSCYLIELSGEYILIDAGSGMLSLPMDIPGHADLSLLLTHPHVDHLLGLPMCPYLFRSDAFIHLYAAQHEGRCAEEQVKTLVAPPLWPVGPEMLPGRVSFHDLPARLQLGGNVVESMEGQHPGGVTLFRITGSGKCVVIITDCTITDSLKPKLIDFAKDCDLLLCDGQYSAEEWAGREFFGHNTWIAAAELARDANCAEVRIVHHDPTHADEMLDAAEAEVSRIYPRCSFGREGEVILL